MSLKDVIAKQLTKSGSHKFKYQYSTEEFRCIDCGHSVSLKVVLANPTLETITSEMGDCLQGKHRFTRI